MTDSDKLFKWALEASKKGDNNTALEILDELLEQDPHHVKALYLIIQLTDDKETLRNAYKRILEIKPVDSFASEKLESLERETYSPLETQLMPILVFSAILIAIVVVLLGIKLFNQRQDAKIAAAAATARAMITPTRTLLPTYTPKPTATMTENSKENLYIEKLGVLVEQQQENMREFAILNGQVASNLSLLNNNDWIIKTAVVVAYIREISKSMAYIEPVPASMREVDKLLEKSWQSIEVFYSKYTRAVDSRSPDELMKAKKYLDEANNLVLQAAAILSK